MAASYISNLKAEAVTKAKSQPKPDIAQIDVDNPSKQELDRLLSKSVNFGKYKGYTFQHVLMNDYNYFKWMVKKMKPDWVMTKVFTNLV